jgi:hypothetical protein
VLVEETGFALSKKSESQGNVVEDNPFENISEMGFIPSPADEDLPF